MRFRFGPFPTTLLEIPLLLLLAVWTWKRGAAGWRNAFDKLRETGWVWPVALWLVAGIIGIAIAPDKIAALGLWRAYFLEPIMVFFMLADLVRTKNDKRRILFSISILLTFLAAWAAGQYFLGWDVPAPWNMPPAGIRATGPFPYPNALALFAVPAAALCFVYLISPPFRLLYALGFLAGLISTILARSNGGLIALAAAVFMALILNTSTRRYALAAALALGITIFAVPSFKSAAEKQILFKEWSGKVRLVMWKETRQMLANRPILGAGLGAYPAAIKPYHKATWMEIFQYPHNILLNLWSEVGLLGVLAFSWILFNWLRHGKKIALPIVAAILIHGLVDVPYFKNDLAVLFWLLIAVTMPLELAQVRPCPYQSPQASRPQ